MNIFSKYLATSNLQNSSFGTKVIRVCVVCLLFLSLLLNNLSATISISDNNSFAFQNVIKIESSSLNPNIKNLNSFSIQHSKFKNSEIITLNLEEIFELFETELDDFVESFSKDYKFYNNFIIKSITLDRFSLDQAKTIPLYILFHCLKIHLLS